MKKYPLASFFILAVLLGSSVIFLIYTGVLPDQLAMTSVLSASISGLLMTAVLEGKDGLRDLCKRVMIWRVGIEYWLMAVFFLVLAILLGSTLNPIFGGDPANFQNLQFSFNLLPILLAFTILAGLGQEFGWAGFLIPRIQAKYSALISSLIRAGLVFAWHIPLLIISYKQPDIIPDFPYGAWMIQKGVPMTILVMVVLGIAWSILSTWILNQTRGSLLLVSVLHGSEIWLALLLPQLGIGTHDLNNYWGYLLIMVLTTLLVVLIFGPENLARGNRRYTLQERRGEEE